MLKPGPINKLMMRKKKLLVVPLAGLGNRMRVLSSCIQIAQKEGYELSVAWPVNDELGCELEDVFESIGYQYTVPSKWKQKILTNVYRTGLLNKYYGAFKFLSGLFYSRSVFDKDIKNFNQAKINSDDSDVIVASCMAFSNDSFTPITLVDFLKNEANRDHFKRFVFNPKLVKQVDDEFSKIGEPYVGIHIRRTDHADIIKHSPDQNFIEKIDAIIADHPNQKFFLATDDPAVKKFYQAKYEGRIFTVNHKLSRVDVEGVYGAVIELLLLSRANGMICSMISSYSNAAILIGDIKNVEYVDSFLA